jgi:hypothetical protein
MTKKLTVTKPKPSELKKRKRYFVYQDGNVVPLVYIYLGYFDKGARQHDRPSCSGRECI